jgi:hypothetical protein
MKSGKNRKKSLAKGDALVDNLPILVEKMAERRAIYEKAAQVSHRRLLMFRFGNQASASNRRRTILTVEQLEARNCPTGLSPIHTTVSGAFTQSITLTGVNVGDRVTIHAQLDTTDPNEEHEGVDESLHIVTSGGEFVVGNYGPLGRQLFNFTATQANQQIGAFIRNWDADETGTLDINGQGLQIIIPGDVTEFRITEDPKMPEITAEASLDGMTSDPQLAAVHFNWTAQVTFNASDGDTHAKDIAAQQYTKSDVVGPSVTFKDSDWMDTIRGGRLVLTVTATIDGEEMQGTLDGLTIKGRNPGADAVKAYIDTFDQPDSYPSGSSYDYHEVLKKIASQESGQNFLQFHNSGQIEGTPLFSSDNFGGAGIMQITPASPEQVWDWKANIDAAVQKFNSGLELSDRYVTNLQRYVTRTILPQVNARRATMGLQPLVSITVPNFGADMVVLDAIRGYNGYAGHNPVYTAQTLHEYILSTDTSGNLNLDIDATTLTATASWVRLDSAARAQILTRQGIPMNHWGDINYVDNVLGQDV